MIDKQSTSSLLLEVDKVCDLFEAGWLSGERPQLADFLPAAADEDSPNFQLFVLSLLRVDIEFRRNLGEIPQVEDYPDIPHVTKYAELFSGTLPLARTTQSDVLVAALQKSLGDFELVKKIGSGGMGIVFRAREAGLERDVALKVLKNGLWSSKEAVERFHREGAAVASLDHPNIVPVYRVGAEGGCHFLAMKLIEGSSLAVELQNKGPFIPRKAAEITKQVALAIHYAHQKQIVHRDLKPGNVLLSDDDPFVVDFGIAKRLDDVSDLTNSGHLMGTPGFMAPEQAQLQGQESVTTDVYGLGAVLYALLTGNPPHSAAANHEIIRQVLNEAPVSPRSINPSIPCDLEKICLKCLEKNPGNRFQTAQDVADELTLFLNGKPIKTRGPSLWRRTASYVRRNQTALCFMALIAVALVATTVSWLNVRQHLRQARIEQAKATLLSDRPGRQFAAWNAVSDAANIRASEDLRDLGVHALSRVDIEPLELFPFESQRITAIDGKFRQRAVVHKDGSIAIRDLARDVNTDVIPDQQRRISKMAFDRFGKYLAILYQKRPNTPGDTELFRIRDISAHQWVPNIPARIFGVGFDFAHSGKAITVANSNGHVQRIELPSGIVLNELPRGPWIRTLAVSPDGSQLAVSRDQPRRIEILNAETGSVSATFPQDNTVRALAWSPHGHLLAYSVGQKLALLHLIQKHVYWTAHSHQAEIDEIAFNHSGTFLVSADWDRSLVFTRISTGRTELVTSGSGRPRFSADDSKLFGVLKNGEAGIWRFSESPVFSVLRMDENSGEISVDFDPSGQFLVGSGICGVRIWNCSDVGQPAKVLTRNTIGGCRWLDDGIIASGRKFVHFWNLSSTRNRLSVVNHWTKRLADVGHVTGPRRMAASQTGVIALATPEGVIQLFNTRLPAETPIHEGPIGNIALNPDGSVLISGGWQQRQSIRILDTATGKLLHEFTRSDSIAEFSPNGSRIIIGLEDRYDIHDAANYSLVKSIPKRQPTVRSPFAISTDEKFLVLVESPDRLALHDYVTGERITGLPKSAPEIVRTLKFSPDNRFVAVGYETNRVELWDLSQLDKQLGRLNLEWNHSLVPPDVMAKRRSLSETVSVYKTLEPWKKNASTAPAWNLELAEDFRRAGNWTQVATILDKLIEGDPGSSDLHIARSRAHAYLRDWANAERDYRTAIKLGSTDASVRYFWGLTLLKLQQSKEYQKNCNHLVYQAEKCPNSKSDVGFAAWASVMDGENTDVENLETLKKLLINLLESSPNSHFLQNALGAVLYRLGDFEAAQNELVRSRNVHSSDGNPSDWLFQALTANRMGQTETAKQLVQDSMEWIEAAKQGASPESPSWVDFFEYKLLLDEADQMGLR